MTRFEWPWVRARRRAAERLAAASSRADLRESLRRDVAAHPFLINENADGTWVVYQRRVSATFLFGGSKLDYIENRAVDRCEALPSRDAALAAVARLVEPVSELVARDGSTESVL